MANASDFMGAVYDELAALLNISDSNPAIVMQMAWPGFSLSAQDFKPADQPSGPYDPQVAKETFSNLANIAPGLNKTFFQNSGFEVTDLYEILLTGAIPVGSTQGNVTANPLYKLFSDAQFEFSQERTGSSSDPNAFYYPCVATPANWYDDAAAAFWPTLSMQSGDIKPAAPSSPFVKAGGLTMVNQGLWKLKASNPISANTIKQNALQAVVKNQQFTFTKTVAPVKMAAMRPLQINPALTKPVVSANLAAAKVQTLFSQKSVPVSAFSQANLSKQIQTLDLTQKQLNLGQVSVVNRYLLTNLVNLSLPTKPVGTSDGFSISFQYCRINIDRSWLKLALLNMKGWYMYGTQAGEYSTGSASSNPGMFPLLPTSFIAIRNLKITANWSQDDLQSIGQATALGFFDIRNATLNSNTLQVQGLQILGWVSSLMPELPPMPAPP